MKFVYKFFVDIAVNQLPSHQQRIRSRKFRREFHGNLQAEVLRIRYRCFSFWLGVVISSICLGMAMLTDLKVIGGPLSETLLAGMSASLFSVSALVTAKAPLYEVKFVRFWIKRRARLEARSYPTMAENIHLFFLPVETADEVITILNVTFEERKARFGTGWARRWYWWQIVLSLVTKLKGPIEDLVKWGIFESIRRYFF